MENSIYESGWYQGLLRPIQILIDQTLTLMEREQEGERRFEDYGFLVFPAAKAYEGYLKNYFYVTGLAEKKMLNSEHFRIGKALNPDLPKRYRDEGWLYWRVRESCGEELALFLWNVWRKARNKVFHFDSDYQNLTLEEAKELIWLVFDGIARAEACGIRFKEGDEVLGK